METLGDIIHIIPANDIEDHIECDKCPCNPKLKEIESSLLVIHNSFDGRELLEFANEILLK